jgi:hypothetical protein
MTKEFIPYQQALDLKELGFNEPCFAMWTTGLIEFETSNVSPPRIFSSKFKLNDTQSCTSYINNLKYFGTVAPLYQQAFRWLLDKHYLYGIVIPTVTMDWTFKTITAVYGMVEVPPYNHVDAYDYSSKEEAELACLIKLIEIVKDEKSKSNS